GLPMTVGDPTSCTVTNFEGAGWRFCWHNDAGSGNVSTPWRVHKGLGEYYTTATIPIPSGGGPTDVLVYENYPNKGEQILFTGTIHTDRIVEDDIDDYMGNVSYGGTDPLYDF